MMRSIISTAGVLVGCGFMLASAVTNYFFGASLGRSNWEGTLYGAVGVLAVALNALAPFYLSWSLAAGRKLAAAGVVLLWLLCLAYSFTSALGFAAQNREDVALSRGMSRDAYDDTRRELQDLEARQHDARAKDRGRIQTQIDDARRRLAALRQRSPSHVDAQANFIATLSGGTLDVGRVRAALIALFALMVEMAATLSLFAALAPPPKPAEVPVPAPARWAPRGKQRAQVV